MVRKRNSKTGYGHRTPLPAPSSADRTAGSFLVRLLAVSRVFTARVASVAGGLGLSLGIALPGLASTEGAPRLEKVDVAPVWSGHPVRFALETTEDHQYVAFFDPQRTMTVAKRRLGSPHWEFSTLPSSVSWDSHNYLVLAVDNHGFVHVSGNMHGDPLVYFRSAAAHDISRFDRPRMVGTLEKRVTYPQFLEGADGTLYFQYRHGKSGAGVRIFNRYDVDSKSWSRLLTRPLLDGGGEMSAYLSGPVVGPDDYFHLVWVWRDSPWGDTNHDISYARSHDLVNWEDVEGRSLRTPLLPQTPGVVVDPVPSGQGLAGIAFGVGWDTAKRPVVSYCKYDSEGVSQEYNARWEEGEWRIYQASEWKYRWDLQKTGSLAAEISVTPIEVDGSGRLIQSFDHPEQGRGRWILEEETLEPIGTLEEPAVLRALRKVESPFPRMEVRELIFDRRGEYFLRWETLPVNRDRARKPPYPAPTMLRVHRRPAFGD
jgi:hypothetical protein